MVKVFKVTNPDCVQCFGASFGDCKDCNDKIREVTLCKKCARKDDSVMYREKLLCTKLHAWVKPYDFCSWGERIEK